MSFYVNRKQNNKENQVIFGKDDTKSIVCVEVEDEELTIFKEINGKVETEVRDNQFWLVNPTKADRLFEPLEGDLHYKYIKTFNKRNVWLGNRNKFPNSWSVWNPKESAMIYTGLTYFKGMSLEDVSVLSFDIEAYGLLDFKYKETYIISCSLWKNGKIIRKQFSQDECDGEAQMILDFCEWVREVDPSIITGWNIYGYDLLYLQHCASKYDIELELGRDGSPVKFNRTSSKFRYDGANDWDYNDCSIYGREIIDGMFLAVRYDIGRNFPSWKLKAITEYLSNQARIKLQKGKELNKVEKRILESQKDRQFYDASKIKDNWYIDSEREKIKKYCEHDGDDALNFFHLAAPSYFYMNQKIPKSFTNMINKASGSQMNSLMVRAYLQENHSLPKADMSSEYEGALSLGLPGVYKNCFKLDVSSLYPSIMRQYKVYDKQKDPKKYFLLITDYLTEERLKHKKIANEQGTKYDRDMEQSLKIGINSLYGFMGATGLLFNSPKNAAFVTRKGREILDQAIKWATGKGYEYWKKTT